MQERFLLTAIMKGGASMKTESKQLCQKMGYSKKEAAAVSSLSTRTLDYLIAQGKLKAVKIRKRVVIPQASLESLMQKGVQ
jgi:excisionase family DNA binding protein